MLHKVVQLGGKSYFWLEKTNVVSMIQEYQVSGFRVREYEELGSTNTETERVGWNELEDKMVILTYRQTQGRGPSRESLGERAGEEYIHDGGV